MHIVVRQPQSRGAELLIDRDIYERPMPWSIWLHALRDPQWGMINFPGDSNPRLRGYPIAYEDGAVQIAGELYKVERITWCHIICWAVESVYLKTALKFWQWAEFRGAR